MNDIYVKSLEQLIFFANCGIRSMEKEPEYNSNNQVGEICRASVAECLMSIDVVNGVIHRYKESKK